MLGQLRNGCKLTVRKEIQKPALNFIDFETSRNILSSDICNPIKTTTVVYKKNKTTFCFNDLTQEEKNYYYKEIHVNIDKAINISCSTQNQKGPVWLAHRKKRITASVAHPFVTFIKNNHTAAEWDKKVYTHLNNKFQGNAATLNGVKGEQKARDLYAKETGQTVIQSGLLVNPRIPWLGYSPDGIIVNKKIIEVKCPEKGKKKKIEDVLQFVDNIKVDCNGEIILKKTKSYYCQIQIGMFVTNLKLCDLILFATYDSSYKVISVPYDEMYVNETISHLSSAYFGHILKKLVTSETNTSTEVNNNNPSERTALSVLTNTVIANR